MGISQMRMAMAWQRQDRPVTERRPGPLGLVVSARAGPSWAGRGGRLAHHFRCEPADGPPRTPPYGPPRREIDVLVDPERLRKLDLTVLEE
jgi:hypothetical protein